MAKVNICNVDVLDNPSHFLSNFKFRITFECYESLEDDLEWKLIYVSSAYQQDLDQTLDSILVGPVPVGRHQFVFETEPPKISQIPVDDAVGVTVVLIKCYYREREFIRVGYYLNNEYTDEELKENPPSEPNFKKLQRHILASDPRVTRFPIDWGDCQNVAIVSQSCSEAVGGLNGNGNQTHNEIETEKGISQTLSAAADGMSETVTKMCEKEKPNDPPTAVVNGNNHEVSAALNGN